MKRGKVFLVGAGPGAFDLITMRGADALARADVVVFDALANPELLALAPPGALKIDAGKRGGERKRQAQAELSAALVAHARRGRTVVRLKGGDPFIFGRGGEEAEALARAKVDFEVIPGVTSAIAAPAYAGVPLTHRDFGSFVAFVTAARESTGNNSQSLEHLARAAAAENGTIVILMAAARLRATLNRLLGAGLARETPCAAIEWGTTASQRALTAPLADLARICEREKLRAPAVIVAGKVARLARTLDWARAMPLFGVRIVVTRAADRVESFARGLRRLGAEVIAFATIETRPPASWRAADRAIARAADFDWIVFTSAEGVRAFFSRLRDLGRDLRSLGKAKIAAIGPATADLLADYSIRVDSVPRAYRAEEIVTAIGTRKIRGSSFLIPRAQVAREALPAMLLRAGAREVVIAPVYRTVAPKTPAAARIRKLIEAGDIDLVTFTSSSTAINFRKMIGPRATKVAAAAIGPITAATARTLGFKVVVAAREFTAQGLSAAIAAHFKSRRRR